MEYAGMAGKSSGGWLPSDTEGASGRGAGRPANLSGQSTLPDSASGKSGALERLTPTGQISKTFEMNLSGQ